MNDFDVAAHYESALPGLVFLAALLALFWLGVGIAIGYAWGTS